MLPAGLRTAFDSLALYPQWFVALSATLTLALGVWMVAKILKWALYLAVGLVLITGGIVTLALLFGG